MTIPPVPDGSSRSLLDLLDAVYSGSMNCRHGCHD